jgi:hypothetical protein
MTKPLVKKFGETKDVYLFVTVDGRGEAVSVRMNFRDACRDGLNNHSIKKIQHWNCDKKTLVRSIDVSSTYKLPTRVKRLTGGLYKFNQVPATGSLDLSLVEDPRPPNSCMTLLGT